MSMWERTNFRPCWGGQYQNEYRKECKCGREWVLNEISELLAEISEEDGNARSKI